jgi:hypothetical protein
MSTIKVSMERIAALVQAGVVAKLESDKVPWAYRLTCARFTEAVLKEHQRYAKAQEAAVRRYGMPDKDKGTIAVMHPENTNENIRAFNDALSAMLATEVELVVEPLSLEKLTETSGLTAGDIRYLGPLLIP